ncbi:DUF1292 domain-containing protein [Clostridium oryzae]|uniref:UPF0473 protein CLORY_11320 n=1 Tax=Clostridium oryzae TaxID=1450648 RepID=A0A1V4IV17_9CLOT|nr:DUF1292 domain-containing protein [Clostridium oryzae]OPJ63624.1 hypothetical protein CLORY_11320 [Clostridium oryzae]
MENDMEKIVLKDEDGEEREFDVVTKLDIEDKEYVIVVPSDGSEEEAIALRIENDENGGYSLITIEDEEEFQIVCDAYNTIFSDDEEV